MAQYQQMSAPTAGSEISREVATLLSEVIGTVQQLLPGCADPALRGGLEQIARATQTSAQLIGRLAPPQQAVQRSVGEPMYVVQPRRTVLVVEDNADLRDLIRRALEHGGHRVVAVDSPAAAERQLTSASYDLLLADLNLRGTSCSALIERAGRRDPRLGILVMTGWNLAPIETLTAHYRLDALIRKPFALAELQQAVAHVVALVDQR